MTLAGRRCAVYRHFSQVGQLLYVGRSFNPDRRWTSLKLERWAQFAYRRDDLWLPSLAEAKRAERVAIKLDSPLFNVQGVGGFDRSGRSPGRAVLMPDGADVICSFAADEGWLIGSDAIKRWDAERRRGCGADSGPGFRATARDDAATACARAS